MRAILRTLFAPPPPDLTPREARAVADVRMEAAFEAQRDGFRAALDALADREDALMLTNRALRKQLAEALERVDELERALAMVEREER